MLEPLLNPSPVSPPEFYYDLLAPLAKSLDIWESEYLQVLEGANPVKEWTKGTWLGPLLAALDEPERSGFEADYASGSPLPIRARRRQDAVPVPPHVPDRDGGLNAGHTRRPKHDCVRSNHFRHPRESGGPGRAMKR